MIINYWIKGVFIVKKDSQGGIMKYKAQLVAKEYVQQQGLDFDDVYMLVARMEIVHLIISLATHEGWEVYHIDVKSTFLNGELIEEVYV